MKRSWKIACEILGVAPDAEDLTFRPLPHPPPKFDPIPAGNLSADPEFTVTKSTLTIDANKEKHHLKH